MGTKNYPINHRKDGKVIYEIDGALYADLAQVPDESDRAMLAAMQDGSFERESDNDFGAGMDTGARAADTARMRMIFLGIFLGITVLMLLVAAVPSYSVISQVNREVPGSWQRRGHGGAAGGWGEQRFFVSRCRIRGP